MNDPAFYIPIFKQDGHIEVGQIRGPIDYDSARTKVEKENGHIRGRIIVCLVGATEKAELNERVKKMIRALRS